MVENAVKILVTGFAPFGGKTINASWEAYFSTLPVRKIVEAIEAVGVPAQISNSAGTYVCNHVMYRLLHEANTAEMPFLTGFIHVPYCEEQVTGKDNPALPLQDICIGLEAGVRVVVEAVLE